MDIDSLRVQIVTAQTIREKKHYTIYEIEVRSSSTIAWFIWKRYSQVHEFHQLLVKSLEKDKSSSPSDSKESKEMKSSTVLPSQLPQLPPKRMTRFMSMAPEFVEKRKNELQDYLSALVEVPGLLTNTLLLNFLEAPESVRAMLTTTSSSTKSVDMKDLSPEARNELKNLSTKSYEERRIHELVSVMKNHPARVAAIKSFEDFFFDSRPRISAEMIRLLFQGRSGQDNDGGLVQTCGDIRYSRVAASAALYLLVRLLDVEKNKDAQLFLDQFVSLDPTVLRRMKLDQHIISDRGNRLAAFRVIAILKAARQAGANELDVDRIVGDPSALKEFKLWSDRANDTSLLQTQQTQQKFVKAVTVADNGFKVFTSGVLRDVLSVSNDNANWRIVRNSNTAATFGTAGGFDSNDPLNNVLISYRPQPTTAPDCTAMKVMIVLPFSPSEVSKYLMNISSRCLWDPKFVGGRVVQQIDNETDILHLIFKSFISPYKFRDVVVCRNVSSQSNGSTIIHTYRSVVHSSLEGNQNESTASAPNSPKGNAAALSTSPSPTSSASSSSSTSDRNGGVDSTRAVLYPSAFIMERIDHPDEYCLFSALWQLDSEAILLVTPDLLSESNEIRTSMWNLRMLIEKQRGGVKKSAQSVPQQILQIWNQNKAAEEAEAQSRGIAPKK